MIDREKMDADIRAAGAGVTEWGRAIYRAGYLAGMRRAGEIAVASPVYIGTIADDSHKEMAVVARRLIRDEARQLEGEK